MRGRRPDAASQDEKGNPGKRRSKTTIADHIKSLVDAQPSDALSPPPLFGLPELDGAVKVWREFAPELSKRNLIDDRLDRHTLAMFCYYLDRFWSSVATILADGDTQRVKTVAGGYMLRDHPAVRRRDEAYKIVLDLSAKFGFTPMDRYKLIREMAGTGVPLGGLFGDDAPRSDQPSPEGAEGLDDIIGFAGRGLPPGQRPN